MIGDGGALAAMQSGPCWLDLTSNDPRITVEIAAHAEHRAGGAAGDLS